MGKNSFRSGIYYVILVIFPLTFFLLYWANDNINLKSLLLELSNLEEKNIVVLHGQLGQTKEITSPPNFVSYYSFAKGDSLTKEVFNLLKSLNHLEFTESIDEKSPTLTTKKLTVS